MKASAPTRDHPSKPRTIQPFVESAAKYASIEVEAIALRAGESIDVGGHCEVCQPGDRPDMFSVYLRQKPETGGLAECIADFSHPDDAVSWASDLARQMSIDLSVRMDVEGIKRSPVGVGESVIAPLDFNAICGSVESVDEDGVAILKDCFDIFGPVGKARISLGHCRRFWEAPRLLGMSDLFRAAV